MADVIDYEAVVADIERKRSAYNSRVDLLISQLRQLAGNDDESFIGSKTLPADPGGETRSGSTLPRTAFSGMGYPEAVEKYLKTTNRKQTARDITAGLKDGGMHTTSKNFYSNVYTTLQRLEKAGIVARPGAGKEWGLMEWYPGLRTNRKPAKEKEN